MQRMSHPRFIDALGAGPTIEEERKLGGDAAPLFGIGATTAFGLVNDALDGDATPLEEDAAVTPAAGRLAPKSDAGFETLTAGKDGCVVRDR